ncbi:uncharacterized protein LOC131047169 [Cryptomeria japonica]|uniref:uncharacterized protein LOC131047169 n=1 Tax=Cryptomeria japonica TaxID=3369 RepID=UPI0027DA4FA8|nr:uncharacterized protein LOC131047169 [Cryptomeria japonica]
MGHRLGRGGAEAERHNVRLEVAQPDKGGNGRRGPERRRGLPAGVEDRRRSGGRRRESLSAGAEAVVDDGNLCWKASLEWESIACVAGWGWLDRSTGSYGTGLSVDGPVARERSSGGRAVARWQPGGRVVAGREKGSGSGEARRGSQAEQQGPRLRPHGGGAGERRGQAEGCKLSGRGQGEARPKLQQSGIGGRWWRWGAGVPLAAVRRATADAGGPAARAEEECWRANDEGRGRTLKGVQKGASGGRKV